MQAAMHIAEAAKANVSVLLYAQQVMYFMLWVCSLLMGLLGWPFSCNICPSAICLARASCTPISRLRDLSSIHMQLMFGHSSPVLAVCLACHAHARRF